MPFVAKGLLKQIVIFKFETIWLLLAHLELQGQKSIWPFLATVDSDASKESQLRFRPDPLCLEMDDFFEIVLQDVINFIDERDLLVFAVLDLVNMRYQKMLQTIHLMIKVP